MAAKPSIPKGTRDFGPVEMGRRNYIFDTIKSTFKRYGFAPIETPSMENLATLTGKYGDEGDKLIFKILNSGDYLKKANKQALENGDSSALISSISEKALRYDLTVPFARFVVQNQNDITFPFKRYQIQNVWRADRPQKGRYREFHQCDADVVGSDSLLYEVELVQIFDEVLSNLRIPDFTIKINNRKVLSGIAEVCGESDKIIDITVAIDKLDKIGEDGVLKELIERGVSAEAIETLKPLFSLSGSFLDKLSQMKTMLASSETGLKGLEELEFIVSAVESLGLNQAKLEFDVTLARGLNYYTGAIFEVKANGVSIGSICGGGRYDDLTGVFGMPNMSGVGISFGADRIYDVLLELNLFPESTEVGVEVMFVNFGDAEAAYCLGLLKDLRANDISAEIYPDAAKMKKQMKYADDKNIPHVLMVGTSEMEEKVVSHKNMLTGEQEEKSIEEFISELR